MNLARCITLKKYFMECDAEDGVCLTVLKFLGLCLDNLINIIWYFEIY
jgi:hypothetical protein